MGPLAEMTRGDATSEEAMRVGPVEVRPTEFGVLVEGERVHLTVRECQVLEALVERAGAVVPRARLYERIWGGEMRRRDRSVDAVVHRVRLKLAKAAPGWVFIHTHFGIGYRFAPEERGNVAANR
jgi:DNA-binding response OmpR family regulator